MVPIKKISLLLFSVVVSLESWWILTHSGNRTYAAEAAEITEAILDYTEGVYTVDTFYPDLVKRGSWYDDQLPNY